MRRCLTLTAVAVLMAAMLAGCLGGSQYCSTVKQHRSQLDSFGATRTTAAFESYARAARDIATVAPDSIRPSWRKVATATQGVLDAQREAGVKLQDSSTADLSSAQRAALNQAYESFNDTATVRVKVVADIAKQCGVKLSTGN